MDVVAHALWTNVVFYSKYAKQKRQRYWAAFFGVLPDLIAFTPAIVYILWARLVQNLTISNYMAAYTNPTGVYAFAVQAYNYSHSLVIWAAIFLIVLLVRRGKPYWPLLGWALHIVIDIFTHPDFFRTPFLFPLSGYKNSHAISWADPKFMAINYSLLIIVYIVLWQYNKRQHRVETSSDA
jgi:hypothetical protein